MAERGPEPHGVVLEPLELVRAFVLAHRHPLEAVDLLIEDALGSTVAVDVIADEALPRFANSAMDGFALRAEDTAGGEASLRVVNSTMAGELPASAIGPGEAVRIMTGAPIPAGADAVCALEEADDRAAGRVRIDRVVLPGANIRLAGEDVVAGSVVIEAGTELTPAHLGLLAALGARSVTVHRRPVVGVLSCGDELIAGSSLEVGKIRDANRPALLGLVQQSGATAVDFGIVGDDEEDLAAAIERAVGDCDCLLTSGGASAGDRDGIARVLNKLRTTGRARAFEMAIRPSKPFVFGEIGDGAVPVFGLPGNPVSAIVAFELLARPMIRLLAGHKVLERPSLRATAVGDFARREDGKVHYARALAALVDGALTVRPAAGQGAHMLRAMAASNALVVLPDGAGARVGDRVEVLLLEAEGISR